MNPLVLLQIFGASIVVLSIIMASICVVMWERLPDNRKAWAMLLWIMYMGVMFAIAEALPHYNNNWLE